MTEPLPLNIGKRLCKDCLSTLIGNNVFRCPDCVIRSIDRHRKKEDSQ